jgi:hypothetical protein
MDSPTCPSAALAPESAPRFYPLNFHPEFGYCCPMPPFRKRVRSACKAAAFGVTIGAVVVFALVSRNQPAEVAASVPSVATTAFARPATVPPMLAADANDGSMCRTNPWPYAGTGCLTKAPAAFAPVQIEKQQAADVTPASELAPLPAQQPSAAPARTTTKTAKRERRKERNFREPDPRSAYAGRPLDRRNGWRGYGGGYAFRDW